MEGLWEVLWEVLWALHVDHDSRFGFGFGMLWSIYEGKLQHIPLRLRVVTRMNPTLRLPAPGRDESQRPIQILSMLFSSSIWTVNLKLKHFLEGGGSQQLYYHDCSGRS